jgi:succinyl-CoA synthetase alpha subunit
MRLDEHASKTLLSQWQIPTPPGIALGMDDPLDAPFALPWVLKGLVLSGGRGKAGAIRTASSLEDAHAARQAIAATSVAGMRPVGIRLEPYITVVQELYLVCIVHRSRSQLTLTLGRQGGMEVESAPAHTLASHTISSVHGLDDFQLRDLFFHLALPAATHKAFVEFVRRALDLFLEEKLLVLEINPLGLTPHGEFLALDAKIEVDDHHARRSPSILPLLDPRHHDPIEVRAQEMGLSFHKLDGSIGLMVNGAGLAMASMDILQDHGLAAANFLDLGGGADVAAMREALAILFQDDAVKAIWINIFGGILSCSDVARALLEALEGTPPAKPTIVRMAGNAAPKGREILQQAQIPGITAVEDLASALVCLHHILATPCPPVAPLPPMRPTPRRPPRPPHHFPLGTHTAVLVQGSTGKQGALHTRLMLDYGTQVVAGVTPGKGGTAVHGVPVYDTVAQACVSHRIDASIIFVPAPMAPDAMLEAAACDIPWVICITDGIPQHDMLRVRERLQGHKVRLIGPNCPGLIVPGATKIGIMPADIFQPGPVAVLSRSGTLTYEVVQRLSAAGIGQRVCIGIGGDPFVGSSFVDLTPLILADPGIQVLVVLGEIGGQREEDLGTWLSQQGHPLPLVGFVAGRSAPRGKRLGHAGAILEEHGPGIEAKLERMEAVGYHLAWDLDHIPQLVAGLLGGLTLDRGQHLLHRRKL